MRAKECNDELGGLTPAFEYDALNRLQKVAAAQNPDGFIASYTYDNVGSVQSVSYANGIMHAYTYDMLNRLTNLAVSKVDPSSGSLSQVSGFAYTLNAIGYRTSVVEHSGREAHYTYDSLGRLTREQVLHDSTVINGWSDYVYDNVGNRTSRRSGGFMPANQDFDYDANDRAYGSPLGDPAYDANGNTIRSDATLTNSTTVSCVDTYDYRNRLIRRVRADGVTLDYTYNAKGTRIAKTKRSGGVLLSRKLFVVDDQNLTGYVQTLEEWTAEGFGPLSLSKVYDYGLDLIAQAGFEADAQNSSFISHTSYFVYDGHGSVCALTDETGTITDTTTYDAFGIQLSQTGSTDNAYLYAGEYFDSDLGLYYLRARHMNPETGRFHTLDSYEGRLGEPLSLHKYMYAHANPVMGVDPSGMFSLYEMAQTAVISSILGGILGGGVGYITGGREGAYDGAWAGFVYGLIAGPVAYSFLSLGFLGYTSVAVGTQVGFINMALAAGLGDATVQVTLMVTENRPYNISQTGFAMASAGITNVFMHISIKPEERAFFTGVGVASILESVNSIVSVCKSINEEAYKNFKERHANR